MSRAPSGTQPASSFDVAIVGSVGVPGRYGGFETLADQIVCHLGRHGRLLVYCTLVGRSTRPTHYEGATLAYLRWNANGWQSPIYDALSMFGAMWRSRTLLVLGVSGCLALPLVRLLAPRTRIVTNIDGLEWQRRKWGPAARGLLRLSEWLAVLCSHDIVADNAGIRDHVRREYGRDATLIPYGGDTTQAAAGDAPAPRVTRFEPGSYWLTVSRIEPENNVAEILEAFASTPDTPLTIVGNWNSAFARRLRARYAALTHVQMLDPVFDPPSLQRLRAEARAYVHGHSAGGTNPSLVEAMYVGLPVVAFDVTYNRHTMGMAGHYWRTPDDLATLVRTLTPEALERERTRLRAHAMRNYRWSTVCAQYAALLGVPTADPVSGTEAPNGPGAV
jgi:glycosyltransferase involved in cell wall biosynthesis